MRRLRFLSEASCEIVNFVFVYFIWCIFYFYFYVIVGFLNFFLNPYIPSSVNYIYLYTPINYFGRYATCSHNKDGGRSHIQSRETIGQENHVTCVKLRPRVNFRPAFGATFKTRIFYKYVVFKHSCSFYTIYSQRQHTPSSVTQQTSNTNNMDGPRRHSFIQYTLTMRLFPVSEKPTVSNHKKKDILDM